MASKNEYSQDVAQQDKGEDQQGFDSEERYQLPRSISPIGLFFGHGASDPRRKKNNNEDGAQECLSEADTVRERHIAKTRSRKPIGTKRTRPFISLAVTIACGLFYMIILKMPLNPQIPEFWVFLVWLCVVYIACMMFLRGTKPRG